LFKSERKKTRGNRLKGGDRQEASARPPRDDDREPVDENKLKYDAKMKAIVRDDNNKIHFTQDTIEGMRAHN
jgi:hypothetical protein